jgi:hypothetical protein
LFNVPVGGIGARELLYSWINKETFSPPKPI